MTDLIERMPSDSSPETFLAAYEGDPSPTIHDLLELASTQGANGQEDPNLTSYILEMAAAVDVQENKTAGFKSPRTGESIPPTVTKEYMYLTTDERGAMVSLPLSREVAERLLAFSSARTQSESDQPEAEVVRPANPGSKTDAESKQTARGTTEDITPPNVPPSGTANGGKGHPKRSTKRDDIADLVTLDTSGRARYESGSKIVDKKAVAKLAGKIMSKHELELITEHQAKIRQGVEALHQSTVVKNVQNMAAASPVQPAPAKRGTMAAAKGFTWNISREARQNDIEAWGGLRHRKIGNPSSKRVSKEQYQARLQNELDGTGAVEAEKLARQTRIINRIGRAVMSATVDTGANIKLGARVSAQKIAELSSDLYGVGANKMLNLLLAEREDTDKTKKPKEAAQTSVRRVPPKRRTAGSTVRAA